MAKPMTTEQDLNARIHEEARIHLLLDGTDTIKHYRLYVRIEHLVRTWGRKLLATQNSRDAAQAALAAAVARAEAAERERDAALASWSGASKRAQRLQRERGAAVTALYRIGGKLHGITSADYAEHPRLATVAWEFEEWVRTRPDDSGVELRGDVEAKRHAANAVERAEAAEQEADRLRGERDYYRWMAKDAAAYLAHKHHDSAAVYYGIDYDPHLSSVEERERALKEADADGDDS